MWQVGRGVYRVLVGKPERKRPFGRPEHRWDDNVKMDLQEIGWGAWTMLICIGIEISGIMNLRVP
jgi:hypothetical protein